MRKVPRLLSEATLAHIAQLGEDIRRDTAFARQRSIDICWHWWRIGKALVADPDLYVRGTETISIETSIRICEVLGLSTKPVGGKKGRPGGEGTVRRAIIAFNLFPDEQAAKDAIEAAGTYRNLTAGAGDGSRLLGPMHVPVMLLDHIAAETGVQDRAARTHIARYLKLPDIIADITDYIQQAEGADDNPHPEPTASLSMARPDDPRKWVKVRDYVTGRVKDGTLDTGDQITARVAAEAVGICRATALKALHQLCETGILEQDESRRFCVAQTTPV